MNITAPAGSLAKQAENFKGIDFTPLANCRPDEQKLMAIQASLVGTAVALSDSAQYLVGHFLPASVEAMRNTAAMLRASAENLQGQIDAAAALRKSKAANPGEVWDRMPNNLTFSTKPTPAPLVEQLNAANKAFWSNHQEGK